jgi:hypothetical protein
VKKTVPPRVLVATVEVEGRVWFFKLTGASDLVEARQEEFRQFLSTVKFVRGEATCPTPEGWETSTRGMVGSFKRFKSLAIPTETEILDVSVSFLTAPPRGIDDQYLKTNLNRWRDQVKLAEITEQAGDDWKNVLTPISIDGVPAFLADITGSVNRQFSAPRPRTSSERSGGPMVEPSFVYKVPDHWQDQGASAFVAHAWTVGENEDTVKISLSLAGGKLEANVNRWRLQVGLPEISLAEFESIDFQVNGQTGQLFDLAGESRRIIGIIVPQSQFSLFVKITGPVDLVERERAGFITFAQSLKLN